MLHALLWPAAADGAFTLGDRTEARVRAPDLVTNAVAVDLDTVADARAVWTGRHTTYTLADLPRFTLLDLNGATRQGALADSLFASAEWHSLRARVRLTEDASYGQLSFESLSVLPPPNSAQGAAGSAGQPAQTPVASLVPPTSQSILFASSVTSVSTTLNLRPWTVFASVAYQVSGGADGESQQFLPFQQGPLAMATADLRVGGRDRDHLLTMANGSEASFSSGTEDVLAGVEEQWRHRWARRTESLLAAGDYAVRTRAAFNSPDVFGSSPVAEAALDQRFVHGRDAAEARFDLRLAPYINPLTGLVDEQARATIEGGYARRHWNVRAFASAGESIDQGTATSVRFATAEIDASYAANKSVTFDGGLRGLFQEQNTLGPAPQGGGPAPILQGNIAQVIVFFAVSFRAVKVRF